MVTSLSPVLGNVMCQVCCENDIQVTQKSSQGGGICEANQGKAIEIRKVLFSEIQQAQHIFKKCTHTNMATVEPDYAMISKE